MQMDDRQWKTVELLEAASGHFESKQIGEARLNAEVLLAHVFGKTRIDLYLEYDRPVYPDELERFRALCRERLRGRPVQYITGEQFFYGKVFSVDERVLIPRPETELVIEYSMERLSKSPGGGDGPVDLLDIGTGSGCIAVVLALSMPGARLAAVDVSPEALELAVSNAQRHGVGDRIRFDQADALAPDFAERIGGRFDMIVSNPPYIPEGEWKSLQREVREYEPPIALVSSGGFEFYEAIAASSCMLLKNGGVLSLELHADGAGRVSEILREAGFRDIELRKDYSGCDRVLSAVLFR